MKAIILSSGKGKRMMPITKDIPKPMLEIHGETLLLNKIKMLEKISIDSIFVNVAYKKEIIKQYIASLDQDINIIDEGNEPLGTASGIRNITQYFLHTNGYLNMMMEPMHAYLAALVLMMAGIYQFTPYKDACLNVCQSPLSFLTNNWQDGKLGAFIVGYKHGFYCVGCCWALMLTLFALGVMNILWVIVLTIFVLFEKLSYNYPLAYRRVVGAFLITWSLVLVV